MDLAVQRIAMGGTSAVWDQNICSLWNELWMGFFSRVRTPVPKEKATLLLAKSSLSVRHSKCREWVAALPMGRTLAKGGEKGDGEEAKAGWKDEGGEDGAWVAGAWSHATAQDKPSVVLPFPQAPGAVRAWRAVQVINSSEDCFNKEKCNLSPNSDCVQLWLKKETRYFINERPTEGGSCMHWCHPTPLSIRTAGPSWCFWDIFCLFLSPGDNHTPALR